jgi:hypothetical protein
LTPIRAERQDDERSKTVIKMRDRYSNRSVSDQIRANIAIDGYSINGDHVKPRALSQLRTYDNNMGRVSPSPSKIEINSLISKKAYSGTKTPMVKRGILSDLPWED